MYEILTNPFVIAYLALMSVSVFFLVRAANRRRADFQKYRMVCPTCRGYGDVPRAYTSHDLHVSTPGNQMSQEDKAKKAVKREGWFTQFAAALSREEPCKRTQHYRKGRKTNLSRARRRQDKFTIESELE